jgi:hypothetical protein
MFDAKPLEKHLLEFLADRGIPATPKIMGGYNAEFHRRYADLFDTTVDLEILVQIQNCLPDGSSSGQAGESHGGPASASS